MLLKINKFMEESRCTEVYTLDSGFLIFKFNDEQTLDKKFNNGPYNFGRKLLLIRRWYPRIQLKMQELCSAPNGI